MPAFFVLPLALALVQPVPPTPNPVPPTPPPLVTPTPVPSAPAGSPPPSAAPSGAPQTPGGPATPTPAATAPPPLASPSPNPFRYVVAPADPPASGPRIVQIALNDQTLHQGGPLMVRVTTSPDVTSVVARALGREIGIPESSPGIFAGMQQLPTGLPFFLLNRTYQVSFVATTADGRSASYTVPVRLER
ncbi:MAG TPA: hypothetical protein VFB22_06620 [Candidatus Baltobacteraceae bacterium]|nr:hypothetical protein [Candidatus Baltobacteraceae bacterium]